MFKIYKKSFVVSSSNSHHRLDTLEHEVNETSITRRFSKLLAIPGMIVGGLLMAIFFSAFFPLLLIPIAILGIRGWWLLRKLRGSQATQCIDAEYTVIKDTARK